MLHVAPRSHSCLEGVYTSDATCGSGSSMEAHGCSSHSSPNPHAFSSAAVLHQHNPDFRVALSLQREGESGGEKSTEITFKKFKQKYLVFADVKIGAFH